MKIRIPELILIQFIIYLALYLLNHYIGIMLCLVMAPIFLFVLLISLIAEWLEKSAVSRSYYWFMLTGFLVPLFVLVLTIVMDPNALKWLTEL